MNPNQPYDTYAEQAKELSDLFYRIEGRRPRVLVTGLDVKGQNSLHEISSLFADLGCDADMSPKSNDINDFVRQSIENDSDIIVLCSENQPKKDQLLQLDDLIKEHNAEAIFVLYTLRKVQKTDLPDSLRQWILFNPKLNKNRAGYGVLQELLNSYKNV